MCVAKSEGADWIWATRVTLFNYKGLRIHAHKGAYAHKIDQNENDGALG